MLLVVVEEDKDLEVPDNRVDLVDLVEVDLVLLETHLLELMEFQIRDLEVEAVLTIQNLEAVLVVPVSFSSHTILDK